MRISSLGAGVRGCGRASRSAKHLVLDHVVGTNILQFRTSGCDTRLFDTPELDVGNPIGDSHEGRAPYSCQRTSMITTVSPSTSASWLTLRRLRAHGVI